MTSHDQLRIIAIADDDAQVGRLNTSADVLLCLGDLYDRTLSRAVDGYTPVRSFGIRGNHDHTEPLPDPIESLHARMVIWEGLRWGGFGGSWPYKSRGHHLYTQETVYKQLCDFPAVDVFIAHNSPRGIHERDDRHQGFDAFLDYIDRAQPGWFLHGHQHRRQITHRGHTRIIGVYGEIVMDIHPRQAMSESCMK